MKNRTKKHVYQDQNCNRNKLEGHDYCADCRKWVEQVDLGAGILGCPICGSEDHVFTYHKDEDEPFYSLYWYKVDRKGNDTGDWVKRGGRILVFRTEEAAEEWGFNNISKRKHWCVQEELKVSPKTHQYFGPESAFVRQG